MRAIKRLVILTLAVCMLWGMTASVMAASSDETGETSMFTFTNEGATGDGGGSGSGSGGTTGTSGGTTGTSGGTTGTSGGSGSGSTSGAKTADVNTGAYATTAAIAGAGAAALLGAAVSRKRRCGKEAR